MLTLYITRESVQVGDGIPEYFVRKTDFVKLASSDGWRRQLLSELGSDYAAVGCVSEPSKHFRVDGRRRTLGYYEPVRQMR